MKRVIKNISLASILTNSYGKTYTILPKRSLTIEDSQADKIVVDLCYRFKFLRDITPKTPVITETKTVLEPSDKGKMRPVVKKVVKKGKGVKKI